MCDIGQTLMHFFYPPSLIGLNSRSDRKAKAKDAAAIKAANQAAANQVEQNKIANSVQSTEPTTPQEAIKKITPQKVPLNTTNTGATVGAPSSVGLNLGGY